MRHKRKSNAGILLKWLQFYKYNYVLSHAKSLDRPCRILCLKITSGSDKEDHLWLFIYCLSWVKICPKGVHSLTFSRLYCLHLPDSLLRNPESMTPLAQHQVVLELVVQRQSLWVESVQAPRVMVVGAPLLLGN